MTAGTTTATAQIDAILTALPADQRAALQGLRSTIIAAAPEAVEAMSYGAPAVRYRDHPLVSYGAAKQHCAFYVMSPEVIVALADELKGYDTSKGSVRFTPTKPLPVELVTRIVKARLAEADARWG